jgi:hypothetical protein
VNSGFPLAERVRSDQQLLKVLDPCPNRCGRE